MINILFISANSVTIELVNNDYYYTDEYELYINDKFYDRYNRNVISIYDLLPNNEYKISINNESIVFKTLNKKIRYFSKDYEDFDDTMYLQKALDSLSSDEVLVLNDTYHITNLYIRSNNNIYLDKKALLIGEIDRTKYRILYANEYLNGKPLGTWEGRSDDSFASIINLLGVENVCIYGPGEIDCNASNSDWWINHRVKRIARRPKGIFIHTSNNVIFEGFYVHNTPSWNQHPFYSSNLNYLNLTVENPWNSPTTDGIDPESCTNVNIIGNRISVGDDCIAIKSGKIEFAREYKTPSSNIIIRNNLMTDGHAGVTLGSENSGGINSVLVTKCIFKGTDRGLRIKSQRGRGNLAIIKDITFDSILMEHVKSPFVINAFYKAGNDELDYRFDRGYLPKNEGTPEFKSFKFKNIECKDVCFGVGCFLGLPESMIESVELQNVNITFEKNTEPGEMAMCGTNERYKNIGFKCENVGSLILNNVNFIDEPSERLILTNVGNVVENKR